METSKLNQRLSANYRDDMLYQLVDNCIFSLKSQEKENKKFICEAFITENYMVRASNVFVVPFNVGDSSLEDIKKLKSLFKYHGYSHFSRIDKASYECFMIRIRYYNWKALWRKFHKQNY